MRVHHLDCGTMCPRTLGGLTFVCHCLLLETERAGLVLVDTGLGTGDLADGARRLDRSFRVMMRPRVDVAVTAVEQVRALGFRPEDVRHVVLTHLDVDHAGGVGDFPWATVHVHATERAAALARATYLERKRYVPEQFESHERWNEVSGEGDDWYGLRAVRPLGELGDDVALVPLFGHTRGHSGVAVRAGAGWLLHAGDAYFHHAEVAAGDDARAPWQVRFFERLMEMDRAARLANRDALRDLARARAGEIAVFSAHDAHELERMRAAGSAAGPMAQAAHTL